MQYSREGAVARLLDSYERYYNITRFDDEQLPLTALCEFFEHSEKYVMSKKAELWSADCEEFIYLFTMDTLTRELFEQCRDYARKDGLARANIGPGHMYTYITPVFVCNTCDAEAKKALKKCRIYQSFHFSLHGWMDFHAAVLEVDKDCISTNGAGRCVGKIMKKVLYQRRKPAAAIN